MLTILPVVTPHDVDIVRVLFREYERALGVDLSFQGFEDELASLPGAYAPPRGALFILLDGDEASGCVALRPLEERMRVIDEARAIGYRAMRLDTLPFMTEAIALYETLGFQRIAAYYPNPVPGTVYMERPL